VEIEPLTPELYDGYNDFLLRHEESLFYYSLKFKDFLKKLLDCREDYLLAIETDEVTGVLPLMYVDGRYGRIYNSLPYFGSNGGIITDNREASQALVAGYNSRVGGSRVATATIISNPLLEQDYPGLKYDLTDVRIGMLTDLRMENPKEELIPRIDPAARRNIKKALNSGVRVEIDNGQVGFLKKTHQESMSAIGGRAKSDAFFQLFPSHFTPGQDYNIYIAKKDGKLISALLLFYYHKTVEYYTPVTDNSYRTCQPLALIIFQAIVDACKKGYWWWNWGGTWLAQTGVYRFKKKWATMETRYTYYTKVNNQELLRLSPGTLLREYSNFFVIPFSALSGGEK